MYDLKGYLRYGGRRIEYDANGEDMWKSGMRVQEDREQRGDPLVESISIQASPAIGGRLETKQLVEIA